MKLDGKVAIVTGGGTGIGLGISRVLARHGARIVIAQIDPSTADKVEPGAETYWLAKWMSQIARK